MDDPKGEPPEPSPGAQSSHDMLFAEIILYADAHLILPGYGKHGDSAGIKTGAKAGFRIHTDGAFIRLSAAGISLFFLSQKITRH